MTIRTRIQLVTRLGVAVVVLSTLATPLRALRDLAWSIRAAGSPSMSPADAAQGVLFGLCAALAWLLVSYLAVIALLACAAGAPGRLGSCSDALCRRLTPTLLRGLVSAAVGAGVVTAATPAFAGPGAAARTGAGAPIMATGDCGPRWATLLDRPGAAPAVAACFAPVGASSTVPATAHPAPAAPVPAGAAQATPAPYVVRPGDSLWSVAAAALGPQAGPARVAASWPSWWAVNRAVVGPDPSRLHPGELLVRPD